jgi:hypothetical protein
LVKGIVGKISQNQFQGKVLSSFALKGQDGWYSLGEHAPTFKEGDSIQFDVQQRGKYVYAKEIEPWTDGGATQAPSVAGTVGAGSAGFNRSAPRRGGYSAGGKSDEEKSYWSNRDAKEIVTQRRIEIQAARNAAIATATVMFEKELVKVPTKQADKYDAFIQLVEQLTSEFIASTNSRLGDSPGTPQTDGHGDIGVPDPVVHPSTANGTAWD